MPDAFLFLLLVLITMNLKFYFISDSPVAGWWSVGMREAVRYYSDLLNIVLSYIHFQAWVEIW